MKRSRKVALVGYVVFPAAPPRLASLGISDTVSTGAHVNLSSHVLGSLYNPFAAVPSLHFGYALLVGVGVATLAQHRAVRIAGAFYPFVMLFVIVATGNHFFFDAAAGAVVVGVAALVARTLSLRGPRVARRPASSSVAAKKTVAHPLPAHLLRLGLPRAADRADDLADVERRAAKLDS